MFRKKKFSKVELPIVLFFCCCVVLIRKVFLTSTFVIEHKVDGIYLLTFVVKSCLCWDLSNITKTLPEKKENEKLITRLNETNKLSQTCTVFITQNAHVHKML